MKKLVFALAVATAAFYYSGASDAAAAGKGAHAAQAAAEEIIAMRSALAKEFVKPGMEITEDTFKNVCGAVAKRVKEMTEKQGLTIRHSALKYRNPKNAPTPEEAELIGKVMNGFTPAALSAVEKDGKRVFKFTKAIYVEEACLACHGDKDKRPKFIKEKYPEDKAFGFKAGDLRGIITVTAPE